MKAALIMMARGAGAEGVENVLTFREDHAGRADVRYRQSCTRVPKLAQVQVWSSYDPNPYCGTVRSVSNRMNENTFS